MTKITISGDKTYAGSVQAVLEAAQKTQVGQVLLKDMEATGKTLVIKPYEGANDPVFGPCNAVTSAKSPVDSAPLGVGKGEPWYKGLGDHPATREDERKEENPKGYVGTGKGSDVELRFSPADVAKANCFGGKSGSLPDEVFVHELVHVVRKMQGQSNPYPTKDPGYTNDEEFLAVVTANVYISEKGSDQLRENHDGHWPLKPPLNTSKGFLANADNRHLMNIYHLIWRPTFSNLAKVINAPFNPFRQLVNDLAWLNTPAPSQSAAKPKPVNWGDGIQRGFKQ
jgi:hypothetical protein